MGKEHKKKIRQRFRNEVFARDKTCKFCSEAEVLDAHHISDRNEMPNGGYVKENGIALCHEHHRMAEAYHETGKAVEGFHPEDLYRLIGSSYELAVKASGKIKPF